MIATTTKSSINVNDFEFRISDFEWTGGRRIGGQSIEVNTISLPSSGING